MTMVFLPGGKPRSKVNIVVRDLSDRTSGHFSLAQVILSTARTDGRQA